MDFTEGNELGLGVDLQKAALSKRIAALLLDVILLAVLAVGFVYGLTALLKYDHYDGIMKNAYETYESQYGVTLDIDLNAYEAMTEAEKQNYDAAYGALIKDETAIHAYNMMLNISLLSITVGILLATLVLDFAVPLWLGNGQTVGKKAFGIALVRVDGVKVTTLQLFVRSLLGKYTVETMIPVYILLMFLWNAMDMTGTVILVGLALIQLVCIITNPHNGLIHDLMAGTAAVDISSQKIFQSADELMEYTKRIAAERAQRQDY